MCGSATLFFALVWAPVIVLGIVSTSDQVAYYTAASRIAAFILLIPAIQSSYLVPRFAELFHAGHVTELNDVAVRSTRQALALGSAIGLLVVVFPHALLLIFGADFEGAVVPLRVLGIGAVVVCTFGQVAPLLLNTELEHVAALLGVVVLAMAVGLMAAVGPEFGSAGVALLAVGANAGYAFVGSRALRRRNGIESSCVRFPHPDMAVTT
jgi:O-antigen/teichoic acid export membrane protein